jgi:thiol-disulfide isomerase/thioredoxin
MRSANSACLFLACIAFLTSSAETPGADQGIPGPSGAKNANALVRRFPPKRISIGVDREKFGESFKQTIRIPKTTRFAYFVSVQDGWLHVARRNAEGDLVWHIVLARVSKSELPVISVFDGAEVFELSYGGGLYFVRENGRFLRSVREPKSGLNFFNPYSLLGKGIQDIGGASVPGLMLSGWHNAEWFFVASGPDERPMAVQRVDAVVRLNPVKMEGKGYGVETHPGPIGYFFHGDTWMMDDGELLVAMRTLDSEYESQRTRQKLLGAAPPKLSATKWLNAPETSWDKLKGRVVLLDFWGTWCGPCVKKLPEVQKFADKYASRGVVVIGVHSAKGGDACGDFVKKRGISLPIAIDTGETATSFGVFEWPSLFVIDKSGKVVSGYSDDLPSEVQIEKLLKK